jgi:autotransporter-associated beta strand protein
MQGFAFEKRRLSNDAYYYRNMKSSRISTLGRFLLTAYLGLWLSDIHAQTRTWTTTTPDGDSGNWSDSTKWGGDVPDTAGENATFGAYPNNRSIALNGDYTIGTLTIIPRSTGFANLTFALTGSNTLTLNSGLIIGGGTSVTIAPNLVIAADQNWTTNNETGVAPLTLNGIISGIGKITRNSNTATTATSVIVYNGANTFSGGFTQNAALNTTRIGINEVITSGAIASGALGTGTITLNAGTLSSNGGTARTISNNVVLGGGPISLGNSGQNGALTFSDAGLTTASTFTLGSANDGNVTAIRVGGTNLTINQVIAESGGIGQSVNFASTSGTPTVTLNRTKTATGNLLSGGVNLVLANGAANSGSLVGVNGSITATGSNKFSSGALISDNAALIATDSSNYSAIVGGQATVYNNGRVSFATDQTQATVASLFTADSQVRLGLGSGSGNATVTENYDQSAIGNGRAGLVSASTGTITYNGTLTAGSDSTYRVGGGLGTLVLGNALTGTGNNLSIEGLGGTTPTVNTSANNTYTGTTTVDGTVVNISGASGALSGTSAITINNFGRINLTNNTGAVNADRIGDSVSVTLNNSLFQLVGSSTGAITETVGNLVINAGGRNFVTVDTAPAAATVKTLQFGTLTRNNGAVATFRSLAGPLGTTATSRNEIKFSVAPTLVGGGGAAGTTNISILPWGRADLTGFVTYDANGVRYLDTTTEYVQANNNTNARIDQAIATAGGGTDYNVRSIPGTTGNATLVNTASSTVTLNSLLFDNAGATAANTYSLNNSTINVTSGAVHIQHGANQNITLGNGTLAFGSAEGVITNNANGFLTTLNVSLTGTNGVTVNTINGGGIFLNGTNTFTGGLTIGGNGFVAVDNNSRFGDTANNITHGGGQLRFFAGFTSTRGLSLLGNVGDNTLANNNNTGQTVTWNGDISGDGRLRLINNASSGTTNNGFSLGGNNSYTGGTQIEGINVTASTNNALGTGTVTLIGANNNAAVLNVTAAGATLGGLRGTDGTVTINPTASSATLTVGSNNENTVFNGVIAQGAGKTGSLTKTGTGTLVLGGNNTYTGATTVSNGTLNVLGTMASTGYAVTSGGTLLVNSNISSGNITVATGGRLGGSGTVTSAVVVQSGGTLAPGNSPGLPSYADLTLETASNFQFELIANTTAGRGTNFDGVNILGGGSLTIQTGVLSSLVFNGTGSTVDWNNSFWDTDRSWLVFDTADNNFSGNVLSVSSVSLDSLGQSFASVRSGYQFTYTVLGGDVYLNYSAIPEPSTYVLVGLGLLSLWVLRRKTKSA